MWGLLKLSSSSPSLQGQSSFFLGGREIISGHGVISRSNTAQVARHARRHHIHALCIEYNFGTAAGYCNLPPRH
jgi:hypothetical protein